MHDDNISQLTNYIQQSLVHRVPEAEIRNELYKRGWSEAVVTDCLVRLRHQPAPSQPAASVESAAPRMPDHHIRDGILWIVSPFIVLVGAAALAFLVNAVNISSPIFNVIILIASLVGVPLMVVGPIIGIVKLAQK